MPTKQQYLGCILGLALGDALGSPFEGSRVVDISALEKTIKSPSGTLRYTDDTEMAIGLSESLIKGFSQEGLAERFAVNFDITRGYGRGTIAIISMLRRGVSWHEANRVVFPEGSFGNGAAMRVAPVGLMHHKGRDTLIKVARESSIVTHAHPLAIEGAVMVAAATAMALGEAGPREMLEDLESLVVLPEYSRKISLIRELLKSRPLPEDAGRALGCSVAAHESVPAAVLSYLLHQEDYAGAVKYAIAMGGDTDTIAAMAGAISGARAGRAALPEAALDMLENRTMLEDLAIKLYGSAPTK